MIETRYLLSMAAFLVVFVTVGGLGILLLLKLDRDRRRGLERLRDLGSGSHPKPKPGLLSRLATLLPRAGAALLPPEGAARARLQKRLTRAGLYRSSNLRTFLGVQTLLGLLLPALFAGIPALLGLLTPNVGLGVAVVAAGLGILGPTWWLNVRGANRQ